MGIGSLQDLYLIELKDLYDSENRMIRALPAMARAARSHLLKTLLEEHLQQSQNHVSRLERIFLSLNESPKGQKCKGAIGILDEGQNKIEDIEDSPPAIADAALIASAQKLEQYEIAAYGAVRVWAQRLGREEDARLLGETLQEEGMAGRKLTALAESYANEEARTAM